MNKLPETIRIGAVDYTVTCVDGLALDDGLLGCINYDSGRIRIDNSLEGSKLRDVLAHELAHGILEEAGYDDQTEEQAVRIGKVLAMLLRDNDFGFMREDEE